MNNPLHANHGVDLHVRHTKLPKGFTRRKKGQKWPFEPDDYIELMSKTAEGLGSSGLVKARLLAAAWDIPEGELGYVVGSRFLTSQT